MTNCTDECKWEWGYRGHGVYGKYPKCSKCGRLLSPEKHLAILNEYTAFMGNDPIVASVLLMQHKHKNLWQDEDDSFWREKLKDEVHELFDTLDELHEGPVTHELHQIATIAINWLRRLDAPS